MFSLLSLIYIAFSCHVLATPRPAVPTRSINLAKRSPAVRTAEEWGLWAKAQRESLQAKYGDRAGAPRKRGHSTVPLTDQRGDLDYYASISIGTPPVPFSVLLDTGSSDLWVTGDPCTVCSSAVRKFNPQASSSFKPLGTQFSARYVSGNVTGVLGQDTVQMGVFTVNAQAFGVCDVISSELQRDPASGLLGLAFQALSFSANKPFWQTLAERGDWDEPLMTFQLNRFVNDSNARSEEPGGVFTMGFTNKSLYVGDIDYQPVTGQPSYWLLNLTNLRVSGNNVTLPSAQGSSAIIDTGTTLVAGPPSAISQLYTHIQGSQPLTGDFQGFYSIPCTSSVGVSMSFGKKFWAISPDDFLLNLQGTVGVRCVGAFFEIPMGTTISGWVIGATFLKNVYSVFRLQPPSVGFAALVGEPNGAESAPLPTVKFQTGVPSPSSSSKQSSASHGRELSWTSGMLPVLAAYFLSL